MEGFLRFYIVDQASKVELMNYNESIQYVGESLWIQAGVEMQLKITGLVYVLGSKFQLTKAVKGIIPEISYNAPLYRVYRLRDADIVQDGHINDGRAKAKNLLWFPDKKSRVTPSHIVVVNCEKSMSSVGHHFHPQGAVYIPFSGKICYGMKCVTSGVRWTSPLYRYNESFSVDEDHNLNDREAVRIAGLFDCPNPIVFAVTNFDPSSIAGLPNFGDIPVQSMVVRTTTMISQVVELLEEEEC